MIEPSKGAYDFSLVPQYWDFLHEKAKAGVLACPELVFEELCGTEPKKMDELERWARLRHDTLFVSPSEEIQRAHTEVVDWVKNAWVKNEPRFKPLHTSSFLDRADCWLIAYARVLGGRIVTFEKPEPASKKPKIPVASQFGVDCVTVYEMLRELKFKA